MHDAWYFSIATLPEPAKQAISDHFATADIPAKHKHEFERIIAFMNNGVSTDGDILRMRIRDLDFKRQQNLAEVEPEFAELIDYAY
jgi:hypothetical protein